jgi:hypothetical protein
MGTTARKRGRPRRLYGRYKEATARAEARRLEVDAIAEFVQAIAWLLERIRGVKKPSVPAWVLRCIRSADVALEPVTAVDVLAVLRRTGGRGKPPGATYLAVRLAMRFSALGTTPSDSAVRLRRKWDARLQVLEASRALTE